MRLNFRRLKNWIYRQGGKTVFWYLFIAFIAGVFVMVYFRAESGANNNQAESPQQSAPTSLPLERVSAQSAVSDREREIEGRLQEILSLVSGAGRVRVMVTISESPEGDALAVDSTVKTSETNERDAEGGERNVYTDESQQSYVILKGSNGVETPLIIKPQGYIIEGVAIVAEGGDNIAVKDALIRAAYTVLGIPAHKVQVVKMKK